MEVSQVRAILEKEDEVASFYTHGLIFPKLCTWARQRLCHAAKPQQEEGFDWLPSLTRNKALPGL